jgi:hypothetical protein
MKKLREEFYLKVRIKQGTGDMKINFTLKFVTGDMKNFTLKLREEFYLKVRRAQIKTLRLTIALGVS